MVIIPAIDLLGGKCVRLYKGDYAQEKQYDDDPAARARLWVEEGASLIHLVDLDGARAGKRCNTEALCAIRHAVDVPLEAGGGIRAPEDARSLFDLGIDRVVIGTAALRNPSLVEELARLYPGRVLLGADARGGKLAVDGWQNDSTRDVFEFARSFAHLPLAGVIFTDVDTDGTLAGPNIAAQAKMAATWREACTAKSASRAAAGREACKATPHFLHGAAAASLPLIASGGISSIQDILDLQRAGIEGLFGVIVGRALYEGCFTLREAIKSLL